MGLIGNIQEKLSSEKSSTTPTKESQYDSKSDSLLQHPTSGAEGRPTGTAVDQDGYGSSKGTSGNYGSNTTGSGLTSGLTGNSSTHNSSTTGYGSQSRENHGDSTSGYGSQPGGSHGTNTNDRMPGSFIDEEDGTHRTTDPNKETTIGGAREPYDSRKGQQKAADAATGSGGHGYHTSPSTSNQEYGSSRREYEDPSVARGSHGGILNQHSSDPQHHRSDNRDQRYGSGTHDPRYRSSDQQSQHHYGRDAAAAGGAGAAGMGAYEYGKNRNDRNDRDDRHDREPRMGTINSSNHAQDTSYMDRDPSRGGRSDNRGGYSDNDRLGAGMNKMHLGGNGGQRRGHSNGRSMGEAYQRGYDAGYRDAMEHMQERDY